CGGKRTGEHQAFERDIDDARALRIQTANGRPYERSCKTDRREDQRQREERPHQICPATSCPLPCLLSTAPRRLRRRNIASAATNRITSACRISTMSFETSCVK